MTPTYTIAPAERALRRAVRRALLAVLPERLALTLLTAFLRWRAQGGRR